MSRLTSTEITQARIADYAAARLEHVPDRQHMLAHVAALATEHTVRLPDTISRQVETAEQLSGSGNTYIQPGERTIGDRETYLAHLRNPENRAAIQYRTRLLERYNGFRGKIPAEAPVLGHGGSSEVVRIDVDRVSYAMRQSRSTKNVNQIDTHMLVAARLQQLPEKYRSHVEEVVAATYENGGRTISKLMPGTGLDKISAQDLRKATVDQLRTWVETIAAADEMCGVGVDHSSKGNFFYDVDKGFGIIDLNTTTADPYDNVQPSKLTLPGLAGVLTGIDSRPPKKIMAAEDYALEAKRHEALLPVLEGYQRAVSSLPDTAIDAEGRAFVNENVSRFRQDLDNYSDPAWVSNKIEADAAEKRRIAAAQNEPADDIL